jgi:tRNA (cmo5U34)-methyltransferase
MDSNSEELNRWTEDSSRRFLDYGRYFVPEREHQMEIIRALIPAGQSPFQIVELCCGEGLLAEALLEAYPAASLLGLDGSREMLDRAGQRLARFGGRFQGRQFDLADRSWRPAIRSARAAVSSLAIHHLTGEGKLELFRDVFAMLAPGGAFVVADIVEFSSPAGLRLAAEEWDEAVCRRSLELDGDTAGFEQFQRLEWNMYRYREPDDIDKPSTLLDQLKWLEMAGFEAVEVHWFRAGHAIFSGTRPSGRA